MNIQISKRILQKNLEGISKVISNSLHLPALTGIVIEATESNIKLLASNGTLSTKVIIPLGDEVKTKEPGKVLVPGKLFIDLIKRQSKTIDIISNENETAIISDGKNARLNLLNINDYPAIVFENFGSNLTINAKTLKNAISKVAFAAAENDRRVILRGVNLVAKDGKLKLSATNSYRLAQTSIDISEELDFNVTALARSIKNFITSDCDEDVKLNVTDAKIITKIGNTQQLLSLIDGVYPNIDQLILGPSDKILTINSKELLKFLDDAAVMSTDTYKVVQLSINDNKSIIRSKRQEVGSSVITLSNYQWTGGEFEISFNLQFMKEAINKYDGTIQIHLYGQNKPLVVRSTNDKNSVQLVLPHKNY